MTQIVFIEPSGKQHLVEAEDGLSVMVAAVDNQIPGLPSVCNGCCSCGTCHISIKHHQELLSPKYAGEQQVLSKLRKSTAYSRLACQVIVAPELNGLKVHIP